MQITSIPWQDHISKPEEFQDQTILVTGAADGIGRALTISLSEMGATVLMLDKKARHLEKLSDQICERGFAEPVILPIDLMEITPETATTLSQAILDDIGSIHGLVHNAGELGSPSPLDQYDLSYWNEVMHTNLQAPYLLTRALLPLLKNEQTSNVLFTSSAEGRVPCAYGGAYAIAYAGIEAQMTIWAEELEKTSNIKINSIDPGPIRTSLRRRSHPGEDQASLLSPQQITQAYLMLLSNENKLHGQRIKVQ